MTYNPYKKIFGSRDATFVLDQYSVNICGHEVCVDKYFNSTKDKD